MFHRTALATDRSFDRWFSNNAHMQIAEEEEEDDDDRGYPPLDRVH